MSNNDQLKRDAEIIHKTSIGGQAVMEGVMMRGPKKIATAVRKPDGEIVVDEQGLGKVRTSKFVKLPIVRGCVGFFDSMIIGVKALMFSAQFFDLEEDEDGNVKAQEPSKFDVWLEKKFSSEKAMNIVIYCSVFLSLILSVGLFILLPTFITGFLKPLTESNILLTLVEGAVRILIFVIYLTLVAQTKDIKRVFMYHGAEHKSIFCYEKGLPLTVENVRKQTRFHPRCGTSFLLIVMVISILVFSVIPWDEEVFAAIPVIGPVLTAIPWVIMRMVLRLLLLPVVAGLSYEIIKFAGRHDNLLTRIISAPGLWFQRVTTNEPDDDQIEVAITALQAVMPENMEEDKW